MLLPSVPAGAQDGSPPAVALEVDREINAVYDPFDPTNDFAELTVRVRPLAGPYVLEVEAAAQGVLGFSGPGGVLPGLLRSPDPGASEEGAILRVPVPASADGLGEDALTVRVLVEAGRVVGPGTYELPLDLRLLDAAGQLVTEVQNVPVLLVVPSRAHVVLAGTAGSFDPSRSVAFIDFGELRTGASRQVFVTVRANNDTWITLTSQNQGRLLNELDQSMTPVPYAVSLDGVGSDLAQPLRLSRRPAPSLAGSAYPLVITIGDVSAAFAGPYRDDIVVEVEPQ
jgi:hypothetical protein